MILGQQCTHDLQMRCVGMSVAMNNTGLAQEPVDCGPITASHFSVVHFAVYQIWASLILVEIDKLPRDNERAAGIPLKTSYITLTGICIFFFSFPIPEVDFEGCSHPGPVPSCHTVPLISQVVWGGGLQVYVHNTAWLIRYTVYICFMSFWTPSSPGRSKIFVIFTGSPCLNNDTPFPSALLRICCSAGDFSGSKLSLFLTVKLDWERLDSRKKEETLCTLIRRCDFINVNHSSLTCNLHNFLGYLLKNKIHFDWGWWSSIFWDEHHMVQRYINTSHVL